MAASFSVAKTMGASPAAAERRTARSTDSIAVALSTNGTV